MQRFKSLLTSKVSSKTSVVLSMIALALVFSGCPERGTDEAAEFRIPPDYRFVNFFILNKEVLTPFCIRCHSSFNTELGISKHIVPRHPERSLLFTQVDSDKMPQGGPHLSSSLKRIVSQYIDDISVLPTPVPLPALEPKYSSLRQNLFQQSCTGCHGVDNPKLGKRKDLSTYEGAKENAAEILDRLTTSDEDDQMPPKRLNRQRPAPMVIEAFRQWMEQGFPE
jgi:hypothetical protein